MSGLRELIRRFPQRVRIVHGQTADFRIAPRMHARESPRGEESDDREFAVRL